MSTRIVQSLEYSEEDLGYNRRGSVSPRQFTRLSGRIRAIKLVLLFIGFLLGVVGCGLMTWQATVFYSQRNPDWIGLVIAAGVFALFGLPMLFLGLRPARPIQVGSVRGPAKIARVQRTRRTNNSTSYYVATELHIAGKIFTLPDAAFSELDDGATYIVYFWEGSDEVLSLEKY